MALPSTTNLCLPIRGLSYRLRQDRFILMIMVRKTPSFEPFLYLNTIILPRQTRGKHRETQKRVAFCAGKSWTAVPSSTIGESAMARCTPGACAAAPGGSAKFAMAIREGPPNSVSIKFSNDSLHWTAPRPLPDIAPYSSYGQAPGLIATPGGLVLSHGGKGNASSGTGGQSPPGPKPPPSVRALVVNTCRSLLNGRAQ